jgi:hypothetical protein
LLIGFEEKIQELTTSIDKAGEKVTIDITNETVEEGLNTVAQVVFPFRALETKKTADATLHAKAQGASNSEDRGCCWKT